jgi:hypothetical protein
MPKFRKKPVVIEAFQWTIDVTPQWWREKSGEFQIMLGNGSVIIPTLEGDHEAKVGDYIIQGVKGEIYPCKPDIFNMTYDPVP